MKIWALFDNRPGNDSQTLGLVEALNLNYETKNIIYNKLSFLPNIILRKSIYSVKNKSIISSNYPDIVIATGRKLAPISLYIKKKNPTTKIIHLMSPEICFNSFDLIILPEHDHKKRSNILNITGSIHKVTNMVLEESKAALDNILRKLKPPFITVLVGGNTKDKKFTLKNAKEFVRRLVKLHTQTGGSFLITTSRRTPKVVKELIIDQIQAPKYIYDPEDLVFNPYMSFLANADIIVATGDSISMCSEACFTGKKIYIYSNKEFCSAKHLEFHKNLFDKGYARELNESADIHTQLSIKLDEAKRVTGIILAKLKK